MSTEAQTFIDGVINEVVISEERRPLTQDEYNQVQALAESDSSIELSTQALERLRPYLYQFNSSLDFAFSILKLAGFINLAQWKELHRHLELDYANQSPDLSHRAFFAIYNRILSERRAQAQ